ncbi:unnamed protein product [Adineta ricciae]|uniref:Uncharacterized protein n=1 Tax=Adineta ricciae TaxID=249248 RepID=A0A814SCJ3_ADIRI|nr:unnamed protein product [Adineta ricciae]CAF1302507.1 unnamed protein product [Adineta ricciae]
MISNTPTTINLTNISTAASNSADISTKLYNVYRKQAKRRTIAILLIILILIMASTICFICIKASTDATDSGLTILPLVLGVIIAIPAFVLLIAVYYNYQRYRFGYDWMKRVQYCVKLDGELWQKQIDSLQNTLPTKNKRISCRKNDYDQYKTKTTGYVVFTEKGIIVDEILCFQYDSFVIYAADLIEHTRETGLCVRLIMRTESAIPLDEINSVKRKNREFEVNLLMAKHHSTKELVDLPESILANSEKCLLEKTFSKRLQHLKRSNPFSR